MEYASGGDLKKYLDLCRQTVQQNMGESLSTSADTRKGNHYPLSIINVSCCLDHIVLDSISNDERSPGLISESKIRNFAFQIACGLEHLHSLDVSTIAFFVAVAESSLLLL